MARTPLLQLSCYLTLALAAVCLGFAELFFLSWMPWFLIALLLLMAAAWKCEGRFQLSEPAANSIGLLIAFAMLGWIVFQLPRNEEELLAAGVPWPAGLLPHLGPLLMILTAVKLFRPKKVPDFWVLQILGVMMVTLASVLAGEADHGVWVFLYLAGLLWCLANVYQMQSVWGKLSVESRGQTALFAPEERTRKAWRRELAAGVGAALLWSVVVAGFGAGLFLLAPRHASVQWMPHKLSVAATGRVSTGVAVGMDLNRVGKIELSDEVAFEVITRAGEGRAATLPPNIYWRGETLDYYQNGRWYASGPTTDLWPGQSGESDGVIQRRLSASDVHPTKRPTSNRPDGVPADKTYLTFTTLRAMAGMLVAAEPVDIDAGIGRFSYADGQPRAGIFEHIEGTDTVATIKQSRRATYNYGQVLDLSTSVAMQKARMIHPRYLQKILIQSPPAELVGWARSQLSHLAGLSEAERTLDEAGYVPAPHHRRVALALTDYFAQSGEYMYSLNIRRVDATKDPNVDFILNVKEGHCERYASGLALTLRGLGIPCRVVHGFRGWEQSDDEPMKVRFNQAHSWVQALVPRANGDGNDWLLLDATPSLEAPVDHWQAFVDWIGKSVRAARAAFRTGVLEYGSDQQMARLRAWWPRLRSFIGDSVGFWPLAAVILAAALVCGFLQRRIGLWWQAHRSVRLENPDLPWLAEALTLVAAKTGQSPAPSQTLLEFAAALRLGPSAALGEAFEGVARAANRARFGRLSLSDDDRFEFVRSLDALRLAAVIAP